MKESKMVENSPRTGTEHAGSSKPINVSFVVYEAAQSRLERVIKRLWITTIILIILLVGSNIAWLIYESQFEYYDETTITQEAENESGDIIMNGTGELTIDGQSEADNINE